MDDKKQLQISPKQRNCLLHQCCFWAYHLAVLALALAMIAKLVIAFMISKQVQTSSQLQHSRQTVDLWQKGYIIDIKSVNTNNCPQGYTPLLNYTWPGTSQGCFCATTVSNYTVEYILNGKCTAELTDQGCKQIQAMGEQSLQMWKGGKLVCLKRALSLNFYDSIKTVTPDGQVMKNCSQGKKYQVNVLPNVACPITQISNSSLGTSATTLLLDPTHSQKLSYSSQTHYPIADFKVSESSFCQFLSQNNISPNKIGNYKLELSKYQPCPTQDPRYLEFDKLNQEEFFTNNTRVYDKLSQLPGYPRPSTNYVFKLGFIRYPEWAYACRMLQTHHLNHATEHLLYTNQSKIMLVMLCVSIPCLGVIAILFRMFFAARHIIDLRQKMMYNAVFLTDDEIVEQLPNLTVRKSKSKQTIIFIIEQLLRLAVLIIVIIALLKMMQSSVWIKEVFKYNCTETYLYNILRFYQQKIDLINETFVQVLFIWCVLFLIDIAFFISRFIYTDLTHKTQPQTITESHSAEQLQIIRQDKQLNQLQPEQSSEVILQRQRQVNIKDVDDIMGEFGGETKFNFYGDLDNSDTQVARPLKKAGKKATKGKKGATGKKAK